MDTSSCNQLAGATPPPARNWSVCHPPCGGYRLGTGGQRMSSPYVVLRNSLLFFLRCSAPFNPNRRNIEDAINGTKMYLNLWRAKVSLVWLLKQLAGATPTQMIKPLNNYYIGATQIKMVQKCVKASLYFFNPACGGNALTCQIRQKCVTGTCKKMCNHVLSMCETPPACV